MVKKKEQEYRYLFGPVPSRRLGLSLGIDLMPHKTCSLDCVYCECGATNRLTTTCDAYVPVEDVLAELDRFLATGPPLDFVTFSGSGEPMLHSGIGTVIQFLNREHPSYSIALLSNGTLFYQASLRQRVLGADLIKISLDAASLHDFRRINRPHPTLDLNAIIEGLVALRQEFANTLWLEIFIVPGINDNPAALDKLKACIQRIQPDQVQLNTLDRPGTEAWVRSANQETVKRIADYIDKIEILGPPDSEGDQATLTLGDPRSRLIAMVRRRPCTAKDIATALGLEHPETVGLIHEMIHAGAIEKQEMPRGTFFMARG